MDAEVEVPLDVGGLDLDALFFILPSLHTNHLVECNSHQNVHEHCWVEESNLKEAESQQNQKNWLDVANWIFEGNRRVGVFSAWLLFLLLCPGRHIYKWFWFN